MFSVAADLFGFPMFASLSVEHTKARSQEYTTNNVGRVSPPKTLKASGKRINEGQECKIVSVGAKVRWLLMQLIKILLVFLAFRNSHYDTFLLINMP